VLCHAERSETESKSVDAAPDDAHLASESNARHSIEVLTQISLIDTVIARPVRTTDDGGQRSTTRRMGNLLPMRILEIPHHEGHEDHGETRQLETTNQHALP